MKLNFSKAIRNTHRHPVSRALHLVGLSLYVTGFTLLVIYYFGRTSQDISFYPFSLVLFPIAVILFIAGHKNRRKFKGNDINCNHKVSEIKDNSEMILEIFRHNTFFTCLRLRLRLRNHPQTLPSQIPLSNPHPRLDSRDY